MAIETIGGCMSSITDVYSPRTTFRCTRLRGAKVGNFVQSDVLNWAFLKTEN